MSTCERLASAASLDAELAVPLRRPCTAHVHSASRQVVSLLLENGSLISPYAAASDDAPWGVRGAVPDRGDGAIDPGDLVHPDASGIRFRGGDAGLAPAQQRVPVPAPTWYPAAPAPTSWPASPPASSWSTS